MTNKELAESLEAVAGMIEWDYPINYAGDLLEAAKRLRESEPQRNGHWYEDTKNDLVKCSCCNRACCKMSKDFCAYCGAKMNEVST